MKGNTTMLLNRTLKMVLLLVVGIAIIAVGLTQSLPVAGQMTRTMRPRSRVR